MSIDDIMELVAAAERAYAEASAASAGTAHEVAHEEARAAVRGGDCFNLWRTSEWTLPARRTTRCAPTSMSTGAVVCRSTASTLLRFCAIIPFDCMYGRAPVCVSVEFGG
jgi:hypothetical protein